jgi:hypothetical protein
MGFLLFFRRRRAVAVGQRYVLSCYASVITALRTSVRGSGAMGVVTRVASAVSGVAPATSIAPALHPLTQLVVGVSRV